MFIEPDQLVKYQSQEHLNHIAYVLLEWFHLDREDS